MLQQHLPFTVLKLLDMIMSSFLNKVVATAPTVYGIETLHVTYHKIVYRVATAPTVYGIETLILRNYGD